MKFRAALSLVAPLAALVLASGAIAQNHGNHRDLLLETSIDSTSPTDAAKLVAPHQWLHLGLRSPNGSLVGNPALIAAEVRPRTSDVAIDLPGEVGVLGVGYQLFFLVDGTQSFPAFIPGAWSVTAGGFLASMPMPDLSPLGPVSVFLQGATFDPQATNGFAFTRVVRHDTELLDHDQGYAPIDFGPYAYTGYSLSTADLNGDGFGDVVVGIPGANPSGIAGAGVVRILYGPSQTTVTEIQPPTPQAGAWFGSYARTFDVTGDGVLDLVVGARFEDVNGLADAGAVYVFPGPSFATSIRILAPTPTDNTRFGHAVAATDFDGDGAQDLVVGAPKADFLGVEQVGRVFVFRGGPLSLLATLENPSGEALSKFGYGLAAADFNGDGRGDIAVGVPYQDLPGAPDTGTVVLFHGGSTAPAGFVTSAPNAYGLYGHTLVAEEVDGDGVVDLVIAAEFANDAAPGAGAVEIASGPGFANRRRLVSPNPAGNGGFGSDVAVADLNRDGYEDLLVGAFYHPNGALVQSGQAVAFLGPSFEITKVLAPTVPEAYAEAGRRVAAGDLDGDGFAEALFAAHLASPGGAANAREGLVTIRR